jgi:arylsulfatase A-like enzyme
MRLLISIAFLSCGACFHGDVCRLPSAPLVTPRASERTRNVILVTIDGVRWQEIFGGVDHQRSPSLACGGVSALLPNLHALADVGVSVHDIASSGPNFVSLPGYREIVTGRANARCTNNDCRAIDEETLLDEIDDTAVVASWEKIALAAVKTPRRQMISAGRHAGATRDRLRVNENASHLLDENPSAYPGWGDYRPDRYTMALAREVLSAKRPRFFWIALGDTDEYAHRGDYPGYLDALRSADRFIGELWQILGTLGEYGAETTILVTADHGRARDFRDHGRAPESARVWLIAAGGAVPRGIASGEHRLRDVAPTIRSLLDLPEDHSREAGAPIAELVHQPLVLSRAPAPPRPVDATARR